MEPSIYLHFSAGNNRADEGNYDYAGNPSTDGANNYLYDAENRICAVQQIVAGGVIGYLYAPNGTRLGKNENLTSFSCDMTKNGMLTANGIALTTAYDSGLQGEQLEVTDGQFNLQQYNIMWQGKLLGTFQGATYAQSDWHFAVNDWLGTKRVITNSDGSYSTSFYSGPFGDFQTQFGAGSDPSDQHFTSKERDQESGNDYFGARYYASNFGRFMSPDWSKNPQGVPYADFTNPQSLNLYSYVSNNPLSKTDPSGHCDANGQNCSIWDHIAGAVGGVLNIVPQTINLTNSIVNSAISPFTSYQFPMLDTIHPDTHTSAVGLQTGSALQMTLPLAGSAGGAALSEAAEAELGGTALARQLGQAGEDSVGITGPKTAIEIAGSGQIRIPDALTDTTLTEVKNVGSLSYTQQLQDFTTYSQANGLNFELWVRPSTQLSGPLQQAIANGQITLRFIPGAP